MAMVFSAKKLLNIASAKSLRSVISSEVERSHRIGRATTGFLDFALKYALRFTSGLRSK
jgi:hypothetical protein